MNVITIDNYERLNCIILMQDLDLMYNGISEASLVSCATIGNFYNWFRDFVNKDFLVLGDGLQIFNSRRNWGEEL